LAKKLGALTVKHHTRMFRTFVIRFLRWKQLESNLLCPRIHQVINEINKLATAAFTR